MKHVSEKRENRGHRQAEEKQTRIDKPEDNSARRLGGRRKAAQAISR